MAQLVWFALVASAVAFAANAFFGSAVAASAEQSLKTVTVLHNYREGVHELSGMAMVPSPCHDLLVRTKDLDAATTILVLESWEQPYRTCTTLEQTARAFKVAVYAPPTVAFKALVDNEWVPLALVER